MPGMIQRFVSHATGEASITNDSYHMVITASKVASQGHAQSR
jgi:hypothetical protein